jgi:hypothetical protein
MNEVLSSLRKILSVNIMKKSKSNWVISYKIEIVKQRDNLRELLEVESRCKGKDIIIFKIPSTDYSFINIK